MEMSSGMTMVSSSNTPMSMSVTAMTMSSTTTASSKTTGMSMATSTSSSDMDMSSSSLMGMSSMSMTFFTSTGTPLFSDTWTPSTTGQYAGTCVFLIILTVLFRGLLALRCYLEIRWSRVASRASPEYQSGGESEEGPKDGIVLRSRELSQPWRARVDTSRGVLDVLIVGLGYLLMVAVMTMNVGYFMAVLGGTFLGSVVFSRFGTVETHC